MEIQQGCSGFGFYVERELLLSFTACALNLPSAIHVKDVVTNENENPAVNSSEIFKSKRETYPEHSPPEMVAIQSPTLLLLLLQILLLPAR